MFKIRIRAIVGIMIFLGYFLIYIVRYNLSVHIVDMAKITDRNNIPLKVNNDSQIASVLKIIRLGHMINKVNWDDIKVAQLFSAYFIGFCVCFPIFHNIGDRLGPTWVVGIAGLLSGVLNCLTPAAAYYHFYSIFFVRIIIGFCAGAMQPSMVQLLRHWVPPVERNHFMWAYCGITIGTFSTFLLCSAIQYYSRWSVGFYASGTCQILWAVCWVLAVTDYPQQHSCISDEEKTYLTNSIGNIFTIKLTNLETPWKLILKSVPFWALCILNFGYAWMIIAMCIHGPIYYSAIAEYTLYSASALTALPFFLRLLLGTIVIQLFHWYKHTNKIKRIKFIRKYFIVISHVIPGLVVCLSWCTPIVPGPTILTIAIALTAAGMDLTLDLCYEITPMYVNSVNTIIKIIGNTPGIIISFCVGAVTMRFKNNVYVWKHIWCFHALILFLSGVIFLIWGETEVQPWNSVKRRPRRFTHRTQPGLGSVMSNIIEVDEDDSSARTSQFRKSGNLRPFKLSQISV